jgi:Calcineurin-like phosphoesterase
MLNRDGTKIVPGRIFADPKPGDSAATFQLDADGLRAEEEQELQTVPAPRLVDPRMDLADVLGGDAVKAIEASGKIAFHAVGDTGDVNPKTAPDQTEVIDSMSNDLTAVGPAPSFLFHLGDVVYFFGERSKYYGQFYSPFRVYDRPVFAIPGNHDSVVINRQHKEQSTEPSLSGFLANFCTDLPEVAVDAAGVKRETMDQPGVYFTLDAPFVSIIGLFTNALEGPGIISPRGLAGTEAAQRVGTAQLEFLKRELARLKPLREAGDRAVIVACHHPPATLDETHGGGLNLTLDLDEAYKEAGLVPDAVLSGHAHLYEHWVRKIDGREVPYLIAGSGGYGLGGVKKGLQFPLQWGDFEMKQKPIRDYGYLLLTVDTTADPKELTISFKRPADPAHGEDFSVPLD